MPHLFSPSSKSHRICLTNESTVNNNILLPRYLMLSVLHKFIQCLKLYLKYDKELSTIFKNFQSSAFHFAIKDDPLWNKTNFKKNRISQNYFQRKNSRIHLYSLYVYWPSVFRPRPIPMFPWNSRLLPFIDYSI